MKACPIRLTYPALSTNSLTEIWLKRENKQANIYMALGCQEKNYPLKEREEEKSPSSDDSLS
jgi:hypothetical protein